MFSKKITNPEIMTCIEEKTRLQKMHQNATGQARGTLDTQIKALAAKIKDLKSADKGKKSKNNSTNRQQGVGQFQMATSF